MKTLPSDAPGVDEKAYAVLLWPKDNGLQLRIGAAADAARIGTASYDFLGAADGHSTVAQYDIFQMSLSADDAHHDLGWWHVWARVTRQNNKPFVVVVVIAPNGQRAVRVWRDEGPNASLASGKYGLTNNGYWSIENRYDNFDVDVLR